VNGRNGPLYSRGGGFHFSSQGVLVTAEGFPVRMVGGQTLQTQSTGPLHVGIDGQVSQDGIPLGQIEVTNFADPSMLTREAGVYFRNPDPNANPPRPSTADVQQGKTESSNALPAENGARMISLMRHFEMLQHAIKLGSEMSRAAVEEVAKVGG
jgi:flagellar basal body rod protein FlgG